MRKNKNSEFAYSKRLGIYILKKTNNITQTLIT